MARIIINKGIGEEDCVYYFERNEEFCTWEFWKEKKETWQNIIADETKLGSEIHDKIIISKSKAYGYILSDNKELDELNRDEFDDLILNLLGREKL